MVNDAGARKGGAKRGPQRPLLQFETSTLLRLGFLQCKPIQSGIWSQCKEMSNPYVITFAKNVNEISRDHRTEVSQ